MGRLKFISTVIGAISMAGLFLFYVLTMRFLAGSWGAAWWQFRELWHWMVPLGVGFGIQAGLFYYIRSFVNHGTPNKMMAANSATSTVSMIACCAHHAVDIASYLGISALSLWLTTYQKQLLLIGIISNLIGIFYLIKTIKKQALITG